MAGSADTKTSSSSSDRRETLLNLRAFRVGDDVAIGGEGAISGGGVCCSATGIGGSGSADRRGKSANEISAGRKTEAGSSDGSVGADESLVKLNETVC